MSVSVTLPAPPWNALRRALLERAEAINASGDAAGGAVLHALVEVWWREQLAWNGAAREALRASHEINNALVGVSGHAQLLLMDPAIQQGAIRERLRTVLREVERIEGATRRLRDLGAAFQSSQGDQTDGGRTPNSD